MSNIATKAEVIEQLSKMLRDGKETMPDDTFIKVMTAFARLQGWIK
jgi:hypothetical protein